MIRCVIARTDGNNQRLQAWLGGDMQPHAHVVGVTWTGDHWQRLRFRHKGYEQIVKWQSSR